MKQYKVMILGVTGMLGHTLFSEFSRQNKFDVFASARSGKDLSPWFAPRLQEKIIGGIDAENIDSIYHCINTIRPDAVINCIGVIKQVPSAADPIISITINALFPHQLAMICKDFGTRMIHFSTDCVFSGGKGNYTEADLPDAADLYGRSKLLGEVDYPHCLTLRTSLIGHELQGNYGLIEWFLSQQKKVQGFTMAIFSGFPTVEIARIVSDHVIPHKDLRGVYHVSSKPISKYDLLHLVAKQYGKNIAIEPYHGYSCNRSLDSTRFQTVTGYKAPNWTELVENMYVHFTGDTRDG
ncbi:MAG: SDR family oxidoreductase [Deltaproteobacteria bacterium]|nr:SDR family oxidoreductase [Deltaproteobacteria bacterium]